MIEILNFAPTVVNNFLVSVIKWLIEISSSIAVGIILFTVLLKLITFPFDFISRMQMTKNSIKMEEMRPELERLQKQYANDKNLYNQKMMALYKKNGYSMFGSCLPMIVTLVIFIIAINAFNSYSNYKNVDNFYKMSISYNQVIYDGLEIDNDFVKKDEKGAFIIDAGEIINLEEDKEVLLENGSTLSIIKDTEGTGTDTKNFFTLSSTNGYIEYKCYYTLKPENKFELGTVQYKVIERNLNGLTVYDKESNTNITFAEYSAKYPELTDKASSFLQEVCAEKAAALYREISEGFLWVKNIWVSDSPLSHPISTDVATINGASGGCSCVSTQEEVQKSVYEKLISKLDYEKTAPNGYFILCILTAGVSLLMQIITSKTQKAQMELQTVDGQGANTQKMMTWMMPIMLAIFSFMYTAAFSIYMIVSSILGILVTLATNAIAKKKYKAKPANASIVRGRVYDEEPVVKKPKQKEKQNKKEAVPDNDFLSGKADKKSRK